MKSVETELKGRGKREVGKVGEREGEEQKISS